jgi:hypothetical protein
MCAGLSQTTFINKNLCLVAATYVFALGPLILGALAFGHEFEHRTLSFALMQPIGRTRTWLIKMLTLSGMVLLLVAAAIPTMVHLGQSSSGLLRSTITLLPLAAGLGLAPWFSIVCRGPLPGAVFAGVIPVALVVIGETLDLPMSAIEPVVVSLCATGMAVTWYAFVGLQVTGARQQEVDLFTPSVRTFRFQDEVTGRRHPIRKLLEKELGLQQMTLVVAGLFLITWLLSMAAAGTTDRYEITYVAIIIHGGLVSLLAGALAVAEERRHHTAEWQMLLPVKGWTAWMIKAGMAIALAVGLASGLPAVLLVLTPNPLITEGFHPGLAALLCVTALYVSSLSNTGLQALLATVPAIVFGVGGFVLTAVPVMSVVAPSAWASWVQGVVPLDRATLTWLAREGMPWFFAGAALLLCYFAAANLRTQDRNRLRIARQVAWIVSYSIGVVTMLALLGLFGTRS